MPPIPPLDTQTLLRRCDPALLDFETTSELTDSADVVGQSRALDAVSFGIDIKQPGFNLFVLGEPGSGRHAAVHRLLDAKASGEAAPSDWCFVNNFTDANKPRLLRLPPGRGGQFRRDMQQFVDELAKAIGNAFESEEYRVRIEAIQEEFKQREENALRELGQESGEKGVALLRTPHGFVFAPIKGEETMGPEEFEKLPDEEKARIGKLIEEYGERLHKLMHQFPQWRREMQGRIKAASRETMGLAVGHLIEELKERYTDLLNVLEFLDEVMRDVIESGEELREQPKTEGDMSGAIVSGSIALARYQVNLLVDNGAAKTAPVVFEDNPTYPNLVGRVDSIAHMGTLVTNFTLIKPGALARANGGYLVLDAAKVLGQPYAWEGLKRALRSAQLRIESLGQVFGFTSMLPLEPEPMPIDVKVVLVGERILYYLLKEYDPEFDELFKVGADFESELARDESNTRRYGRFLGMLARQAGLRPFERRAVARLIFYAAALLLRAVVHLIDRNGALRSRLVDPIVRLIAGPAAPLLLAIPVAAALYFKSNWMMWFGIPTPDTGLVPNTAALVAYGLAFGFGWLLNRQPEILESWGKRWAFYVLPAIGATAGALILGGGAGPVIETPEQSLTTFGFAALYGFASWSWTIAIIGFAVRHLAGHSRARRYLADASYWIYIVHLPILIALQTLLAPYPWPWFAKYPLILAIAFIIMLASYQWFVRYSFIGAILNGKKQKPAKAQRAAPQLAAAE